MENGNGSGSGGVPQKISCDDVISKLKDDGDFDRLRLKIIRKLKENDELRNSIVSIVKQSVALNRAGAENLKPRQLSDAIHQEIGGKLNERISDGLWEIIRSPDGMKGEIRETVKTVYGKLSGGKKEEEKDGDKKWNGEAGGGMGLEETRNPPTTTRERDGNETSDGRLPPPGGVGVEGDGSEDDELDAPPGFG